MFAGAPVAWEGGAVEVSSGDSTYACDANSDSLTMLDLADAIRGSLLFGRNRSGTHDSERWNRPLLLPRCYSEG
jgi:hypothetical protein